MIEALEDMVGDECMYAATRCWVSGREVLYRECCDLVEAIRIANEEDFYGV